MRPARPSPAILLFTLALTVVSGTMIWFIPDSDARPATPAAKPDAFRTDIRPLLAQYCYDCHNSEKHKGKLDLTTYADSKALQRGRQTWLRAWQLIQTREMPPGKIG